MLPAAAVSSWMFQLAGDGSCILLVVRGLRQCSGPARSFGRIAKTGIVGEPAIASVLFKRNVCEAGPKNDRRPVGAFVSTAPALHGASNFQVCITYVFAVAQLCDRVSASSPSVTRQLRASDPHVTQTLLPRQVTRRKCFISQKGYYDHWRTEWPALSHGGSTGLLVGTTAR